MIGRIFNIQRFSTRDGPGIRTTVYLKGCTLSCRWCHNPESISGAAQAQYFAERCRSCRACEGVCAEACHSFADGGRRFDRTRCRACGACARACPAGALLAAGESIDHAKVLATIARDKAYYDNSGGGATLSGGEPLLQPGFCAALLGGAKDAGVATALDSALNVPKGVVEAMLPLVDLWLVDVKHMDGKRHRELTGASNELILENLRALLANGARLWIRLPLLAGVNDGAENIDRLGRMLSGASSIETVTLLPYHNYGVNKAQSLGMPRQSEPFAPPSPERLARIRDTLAGFGLPCPERSEND